jgi:hypothetical protein
LHGRDERRLVPLLIDQVVALWPFTVQCAGRVLGGAVIAQIVIRGCR